MKVHNSKMPVLISLLERLRAGDTSAMDGIYRMTKGFVFSQCMRRVKNYNDAECLMHEVYIVVMRKVGTIKELRAFMSWLGTVVHTVSVNKIYRRKRPTLTLPTDYQVTDDTAGMITCKKAVHPLDKIADEEKRARLLLAISKLSHKEQDIVKLFYLEGVRIKEIAKRKNINPSTMKRQIFDIRGKILDTIVENGDVLMF